MSLAPGQTLSSYQILAPLGAGGMGEVWSARDTKLGREVAIKVLPEEFAKDEERMQRFEREAKILATMQHPNIAAIYGFENVDSTHFLILEYVEGESLAQRLDSGPLAVDEAIASFRQIADALEAAHETGIVHRDLKPANVQIKPDGTVKVLDFGLARTVSGDSTSTLIDAPTITKDYSRSGAVLGTAPYMSPEQARGKRVDRRADIWAFGCCLFETLSGRPAFCGESVAELFSEILKSEPPWRDLPPETPARVRELLARCLTKDPRSRLRDIGEARITLETRESGSEESVATRPRSGRFVPWLAAAILGLVALWTTAGGESTPAAETPMRAFELARGERLRSPRVSPDGTRVLYHGEQSIWVREMASLETRPVPGTEDAVGDAFWSPDSQSIGFQTPNASESVIEIRTLSLEGDGSTVVCQLDNNLLGAVWTADGSIVFATSGSQSSRGLWSVPAAGGDVTRIAAPDRDRGEFDFHNPTLLSDGRTVVYQLHPTRGEFNTLGAYRDGTRTTLLRLPGSRLGSAADDPASGQLLFEREEPNAGVWAIPFSLDSLETTGDPYVVVPDGSDPSVSRDGTLVFATGARRQPPQLFWVGRNGELGEAVGTPFDDIRSPALSPDGTRVAIMGTTGENNRDIWVLGLDRPTRTRVTRTEGDEGYPRWHPDGNQITHRGNGIRIADPSGMSPSIRLTPSGLQANRPSWSHDGQYLGFEIREEVEGEESSNLAYAKVLPDGLGPVEVLMGTPANDRAPSFSPGGGLVAFDSDATGRSEVYLCSFPESGSPIAVSVSGGEFPSWNENGDELFYVGYEGNERVLMAAKVHREGGSITVDAPQKLFAASDVGSDLVNAYASPLYAPAGDGQRFLVVRRVAEGVRTVNAIQSWSRLR